MPSALDLGLTALSRVNLFGWSDDVNDIGAELSLGRRWSILDSPGIDVTLGPRIANGSTSLGSMLPRP